MEVPGLHPGRRKAGRLVGNLGELHPAVARRFELEGPVACFELDLDAAIASIGPPPVANRWRRAEPKPPVNAQNDKLATIRAEAVVCPLADSP